MLRLACGLAILALIPLIALFLRPNGASAIGLSFVGSPLLAAAVLLGSLWWWRNHRGRNDAEIAAMDPRAGAGTGAGGGR